MILAHEIEVRILVPKPFSILLGRSADGYTGLPWEQVFASSNLAALTNFSIYADVAQIGRGACLRNKLM